MKYKLFVLLMLLTLLSACSLFGRDKSSYKDSDSIDDLSVPPELNLPKRDPNFDIPDAVEVPEASTEAVEEGVEEAIEKSE